MKNETLFLISKSFGCIKKCLHHWHTKRTVCIHPFGMPLNSHQEWFPFRIGPFNRFSNAVGCPGYNLYSRCNFFDGLVMVGSNTTCIYFCNILQLASLNNGYNPLAGESLCQGDQSGYQ